MQLVAGRVAQEYNQRKSRKGAFWEDRYHATAIAADSHLARCLTYIDLNMVRAGVVEKPEDWPESGYSELMQEKQRFTLLDHLTLQALLGVTTRSELQHLRGQWVEEALRRNQMERVPDWSESLAIGEADYVQGVKLSLGLRGRNKKVQEGTGGFILRESETEYSILP